MAATLTGTYALQTTSAMDIENSNKVTVWDDTDGVSTNYYKISYYNNVSTLESSLSDPIPGSGVATDTVRYITDEVLREAKDENEDFTSRQEILDWMNNCQDDFLPRRKKWSFLYTRAAAGRVASQETYSLSTAFSVTNLHKIDHLTYNYNDGTDNITYRLRYVPLMEFDLLTENNDADESDNLEKFTWDEAMDYIRVDPIPKTSASAVFYLYFFKKFTTLDSDGDVVEIPDKRIYKFYCLQQFFIKQDNEKKMNYYGARYESAIGQLFRNERKEIGQPYGFTYNKDNIRRYFKY